MSYGHVVVVAGVALGAVGCAASADGDARSEAALVGSATPAWVGEARVVIDRNTCGGGICDGDLKPVDGDIVYGTWARERAAVRAFTFEVFEAGMTDQRVSDLWQKLDVEVHSRVAGSGAFDSRYVGFDRYAGNNARYAVDLRTLDPLSGVGGCPAGVAIANGDAEAIVELYVTVNGIELRPSGSDSVYRVRYQNYASLYARCAP